MKRIIEGLTDNNVTLLLNGDDVEIALGDTPPNRVCIYLTLLGFEQQEIDTNGWQHDFWITYYREIDNVTLRHVGCWYYGDSRLINTQQ